MRRSPSITWDQLRVGLVIALAVVVVGVAIYKLGQAANLFTKRYHLTAFLPEANGVLDDHIESWFLTFDQLPKVAPEGMESVVNLGQGQEWLAPPAPLPPGVE